MVRLEDWKLESKVENGEMGSRKMERREINNYGRVEKREINKLR